MNPSASKKLLIVCLIFAVLAVALTVVVKFVDVRSVASASYHVCPDTNCLVSDYVSNPVGLSGFNEAVRNLFSYGDQGYNELWYKITKYSGLCLALPVAFFVILGFVQLVKRKSLKKIDRPLKILALFYLAVAAVYLVFDKLLIINYRPVLLGGELEPSYPSSHTLFAVTLCGSAILLVKHFLKLKYAKLVSFLLYVLMLVTIIGRLISGVHWATDILGGIFIGSALVFALAHSLTSFKLSAS